MKSNISKEESAQTAEALHNHLLEMHKEMIILAGHHTHADPHRVGHQLEILIERGSALLLNYFGKSVEYPEELGYFQDDGIEGEHDDAELN
jgi:hypothetical protein